MLRSNKLPKRKDGTMSAAPLIPGRLYRVRGAGLDLKIIASHPCDAICIGLDLLERAKC